MVVSYQRGIYLPEIDLWLDPQIPRGTAAVSHGHSDHIQTHAVTLTTPATAVFMRHRLGDGGRCRALPYRQRTEFPGFAITLYPAGHVLGSAQVLVERKGERLLYSGDFKLKPGRSVEATEVPEADAVIMETTFGKPGYVFPPTEEVMQAIRGWVRSAWEDGRTPILFSYALGKSQELLAHLDGLDGEILLHRSVYALVKLYEELGIRFPPYRLYTPGGDLDRTVLICPPGSRRSHDIAAIRNGRTAYISGWALDRGAAWRFGTHTCFPLSDHADYPDLLEYVRLTGARVVHTVHGFADEFATDLRLRGYDARPLRPASQLSLF
jgi:Cft2 family RNA processing exonuclease